MEVVILLIVMVLLAGIFSILSSKCEHIWEIIREGDRITRQGPVFGAETIIGKFFILKCKKCGKLKKESL